MNKSALSPVLDVQDLTVAYHQAGRWLEVVSEVSFQILAGEIYGLVGESGSGKTTLALAILRYLGGNGAIRQGEIVLNGHSLTDLDRVGMSRLWGRQVALVPQNPGSSLNPSLRIGEQIEEALRFNQNLDATSAHRRALEFLDIVHIADPKRVASSFPHQISGGMGQRVMIAMALSSEPSLLILDEPTTNLDVTTQATILDLIKELILARNTAVLYITHNLGVVAQLCDRVGVLYAGELVEEAATNELFSMPVHPYTRCLLDSVPRLGDLKEKLRLQAIEGRLPQFGERTLGCSFRPRCPIAIDLCGTKPALTSAADLRRVRCHRWQEIMVGDISLHMAPELSIRDRRLPGEQTQIILSLNQTEVHFPLRRSLPALLRREAKQVVRAVDGISFDIAKGETVGLVGESGSGKTTLARAIVGLVEATNGSMELLGVPLPAKLSARNLEILSHLQLVFQNPEEALNPYMTVAEILRRPLISLMGLSQHGAHQKAVELLDSVRLPASFMDRSTLQLSGGEKQRIAIARAIASNPNLLICDESVSSLDVSVQATIINLLGDLQAQLGSSLLFISHDLAVVSYLADIIAVVYLGRLVEISRVGDLFEPPYHPYTEALLAAIPVPNLQDGQKRIRLHGEIPSPVDKPTGCPFHTRCPYTLGEICEEELPPWRTDRISGKRYWCHIPEAELSALQQPLLTIPTSRSD